MSDGTFYGIFLQVGSIISNTAIEKNADIWYTIYTMFKKLAKPRVFKMYLI